MIEPRISLLIAMGFVVLQGWCATGRAEECEGSVPTQWPGVELDAQSGPREFVTRHSGVFNGTKVAYRATVAETIVKIPGFVPAASLFTIAYTDSRSKDPTSRPVVFVLNGRPGEASSGLHVGALGPRRMASFTRASQADPTTALVENSYTVLDVADLVFIDPPDTGYSRMLAGVDPCQFHSVNGDSYAIAQFILHWLQANGRLSSPKFILGESYGSLRAVAVTRDLARAQPSIPVDGLVLVSQTLRYNGPSSPPQGELNPLEAIARLPDVAALAWYHGKIDNQGQSIQQAIEKAREFGRTEYAKALLLGNRLDRPGREHVAGRLAQLTGIPSSYYLTHNLRIQDFRHELLRNEGRVLSAFDGREVVPAITSASDENRDPVAGVRGITESMSLYATHDLGVKGLGDYVGLVSDPDEYEQGWTYVVPPAQTLDVELTESMRSNSKLRLMVAQGLFDTASSMGSTEALFSQPDIPAERLVIAYYPEGHLLYSDEPGLRKFTSDVREFVMNRPLDEGSLKVSPAPRSDSSPTH